MNSARLRTGHRRVAVALAPFLLLQALSGLFLSFGLYRRIATLIEKQVPAPVEGAWNLLMAKLHYGPGMIGYLYHGLLVAATAWVVFSGLWIWADRLRRRGGGT